MQAFRLFCLEVPLAVLASGFGGQVSPVNGFIPDGETAKVIAEAVLKPIYGAKLVEAEKPLVAHLEKGIWYVQGTPVKRAGREDVTGGSLIVHLAKKDARVLFVSHGK